MRDEYDIEDLNSRKKPYSNRVKSKRRESLDREWISKCFLLIVCFAIFLLAGCGQKAEDAGRRGAADENSVTAGAEASGQNGTELPDGESGIESIASHESGAGSGSGEVHDRGESNGIGAGSNPEARAETPDFEQIFDAAEAEATGKVKLETKITGYTGEGYLAGFESAEDSCTFTVEIPAAGHYDIIIVSAGMGGEKSNGIAVDGEAVGSFVTPDDDFSEAVLQRIYLEAGTHAVSIRTDWGWIGVDSLKIKNAQRLPDSVFQVESGLANPNATASTVGLMEYLKSIYGSYILSGQHSDKGIGGPEILALKKVNGDKTPAVLGLDFMEYTPSRVANGSSGIATQLAINFDAMGGINTFCWHWNAPEKYLTEEEPWYRGFYTEATNIDLAAIMEGEDEEGYELLLRDIDAIAEQIAILQEADVPILFRPLHEASGGWFWWGASDPESYIELWKLLFERMTDYHKLNNIIWVWNGQDADWYPGDAYVDIIGEDIYPGKQVYLSQSSKFSEAVDYTDTSKIIALTENGCLFDPDLAFRDQAPWAWFCTWSGDFVIRSGYPLLSEEYTEEAMVKKVYEDERVLTLEDLPDWKHFSGEMGEKGLEPGTAAQTPTAVIPALMVDGTIYYLSQGPEIPEKEIDTDQVSYTETEVSLGTFPEKDGESNYVPAGTPYVKYEKGYAIKTGEGRWSLFLTWEDRLAEQ